MTIVTMKKLLALTPAEQKDRLLRQFTRLGCVEVKAISGSDEVVADGLAQYLSIDPAATQLQHELKQALETLQRYVPHKRSFLMPKPQLGEGEFYHKDLPAKAAALAEQVTGLQTMLTALQNERNQIAARMDFLTPWTPSDVPLSYTGGRYYSLVRCTCPASTDIKNFLRELHALASLSAAEVVNRDNEQHYLIILYHHSVAEEVGNMFKRYRLSWHNFEDGEGTPQECLAHYQQQYRETEEEEARLVTSLAALAEQRWLLEVAFDRQTLLVEQERLAPQMLATRGIIYLEAWLPAGQEKAVTKVLAGMDCAYEFRDVEEGDDPPVLVENHRFVRPFSAITELYGLPTYQSGIDPNPLVAIFFFIFFGMMLGDAMYGLLLAVATFYVLRKKRPEGTFQKFLITACAVGVSSIIFGILFSSYFGDFPVALGNMLGLEWNIPAVLFSPLEDPITMLMIAIVIGVINLFAGMGLAAWQMIKEGHIWDAICDIGFWYVVILGLGLGLVGITPALYAGAAGAVGILLTGGRKKKNIFGKITGGLSSLYNITSYLSDILSYSRLMALGLATGVVAQVINTMGSLAGNGVVGWILFIAVFVVGQVFNMAIGLLGAFVHSCRLIYVEFFGKFFESGGRAFKPLAHNTKYIQVMKEDNEYGLAESNL